ncbi:MAG: hypothetical protein ABI855_13595 [Bacteroidota bacterium]
MPTSQRILPFSVEGRVIALTSSINKEASLLSGVIIISAATKGRSLNIFGLYIPAVQAMGSATSASSEATTVKNLAQITARMWTSHYYQGLNNAIDRGVYAASVRMHYLIPVGSGAVPEMDSEDRVELWGGRVLSGETALIAAGGAPMPYPRESDVTLKVTDFINKLTAQSTATDFTDAKEEIVNGLNDEADRVIKKIWDEVETFYNEETAESMRANAREWGVKYITIGEPTQITFKAVRSDNGEGIEATEFKMISTGVKYTAGPDGTIEAETRLVGDEEVKASHPEYTPVTQTVTIVEGEAMTVVFTLTPLP